MSAVAKLDKDQIIAKVATGAMLKAIATEIGTSPQAISNKLANDPDYRKAREIGAEVRLEEQFNAIVEADESTDVSRAREGFKAAAWFAEREFPERWGNKQTVTVNQGVSMDQALDGMAQALLEKMRVVTDIAPQQVQCNIDSGPSSGDKG